jgi:hypothetical protein
MNADDITKKQQRSTLYEGLPKNSGNLNSVQTTSKETVETRSYGNKLFYGQIPQMFG